MSFKPSFLAPWLLALAPLVQATPLVEVTLGDCDVSCSIGFGATHTTADAFNDPFRFAFDGPASVDAHSNVHFDRRNTAAQQLLFPDADANNAPDVDVNGMLLSYGPDMSHDSTVRSMLARMPETADGPFLLTVNGCAGPFCSASGALSASYSGQSNGKRVATPRSNGPTNSVPEPSGLALALAALGAAGLARRRR